MGIQSPAIAISRIGAIPAAPLGVPHQVLAREPAARASRKAVAPWATATVLLAVGWIGVVLAAAALADYALALFPTSFSSMEWEFGTISQVFAGLPLLSIGLAAVWVSGAGSGRRWVLLATGVVFELAALCILVLLLLFALDIPAAVRSTEGPARLAVGKLAAKTLIMGLLFGTSYIITGVLALKQARGTPRGETGS